MKNILLLFFLLDTFCGFASLDTAHVYTYGGSNDDYARQIISTSDSGFIVVGTTSSFGVALTDVYIIKTDKGGARQWSHIYGTPAIEWGYAIRETYDHGFIVAGYTNQQASTSGYDMYLLKIDSIGNVEWSKNIGGPDWDFAYAIELTPDSGFILCGKTYSYSNGGSDVFIVKTNSAGDVQWQKNYGGPGDESANAMIRDRNNFYAIVGETTSYGNGGKDIWMLKVDGNGDTLWTKPYGSPSFEAGYAIDTTADGNYLTNGTSNGYSSNGTDDMILIKTNPMGNWLWTWIHGSTTMSEEGYIVKEFPNGNIFDGGVTDAYGLGKTAFYMLRNDSSGNYINGCAFGGTDFEEGYSVAVGKDNQVVFAGVSDSYGCGQYDVYLIRIDTFTFVNDYELSISEFCDSTIGVAELNMMPESVSVFPNPTSASFQVNYLSAITAKDKFEIRITDMKGVVVNSQPVKSFPFMMSRAEELSGGIYLVGVYRNESLEAVQKLVIY